MDTADRKRRQISRRLFVSLGFSGCVWAFVVVVVVVVLVLVCLFAYSKCRSADWPGR